MAVAVLLSVVLREVPTAFTAAMMAIAMPVAISPYSMAVAPGIIVEKTRNELTHGNSCRDWARFAACRCGTVGAAL